MMRTVMVTDDRGKYLLADDELEPHPGSVVLVEGPHGTAWQRWGRDRLWHKCGSDMDVRDWHNVTRFRRVVLVYDAPERV